MQPISISRMFLSLLTHSSLNVLTCTNPPHVQKDKEDLEELSTELELADEDELVPYISLSLHLSNLPV